MDKSSFRALTYPQLFLSNFCPIAGIETLTNKSTAPTTTVTIFIYNISISNLISNKTLLTN